MSDASSRDPVKKNASPSSIISGWRAAILSLLGAGFIYTIVPVVAALLVAMVPLLSGQEIGDVENWLTTSVPAQFFYFLAAETITVAVIFGLLKLFRWNWHSIGLSKPRWFHPLMGVAAVIPYLLFYVVMVMIVGALVPGFDQHQEQQIGFDSVHGALQLTLTFFSLVILPPLAEEITMRGFLYTGLRKWLPRVVAMILVSLLFGAAHLSEGGEAGLLWVGALDTFVLSLVLVGLREITGNLWASISLHMTKNFIAFLALFIFAAR